MKNLDTTTTQRIAFIKYLYKIAVEQSLKPEPLCSASILTFHDSLELFLQLSLEYLDIPRKKNKELGFLDYWDLLPKLTLKESMVRLNKSRIALKHHGTMPAKLDIEAFRGIVTTFFNVNTPVVFKKEFDEISLINLVHLERARTNLQEASTLLQLDNLENRRDALGKVALAFDQILNDVAEQKEVDSAVSSVFLEPINRLKMVSFGSRNRTPEDRGELVNFRDRVVEAIKSVQGVLRLLSLGINYNKYARFDSLVPRVHRTASGKYHLSYSYRRPPSKEECVFCLDFVIETAIFLQKVEYNLIASEGNGR